MADEWESNSYNGISSYDGDPWESNRYNGSTFSDYQQVTAPVAGMSASLPAPKSDFSLLGAIKDVTKWGLEVNSALTSAYGQTKNQELQNYIAKSQVEMAKTSTAGQLDVAKINAEANKNIAQAKANYANTLGVAGNIARSVGNDSLMLWLTIAGVGLAFVQVFKAKK